MNEEEIAKRLFKDFVGSSLDTLNYCVQNDNYGQMFRHAFDKVLAGMNNFTLAEHDLKIAIEEQRERA